MEESPILQAMLATQKAAAPAAAPVPSAALKPSRKVTFSNEPTAAAPRGRLQPFASAGAAERPKRDIADYKPPKGFLPFGSSRPTLDDSSMQQTDTSKKFKNLFDF